MDALSQEWSLSCSPSELYTLAALLGGETLMGVPDPFPGWLTEEIQEAMENALRSLSARGILSVRKEGEVVVNVVAAALVGTLVAPDATFIMTLMTSEFALRQINIYHRSPLTTALEQKAGLWALWLLPDTDAICQQVQELWHLDHQQAVLGPSVSVPESVLEEACRAKPGGETEICKRLMEAGVSGEGAQALAHTLAYPNRNGALVALSTRQGIWNVGGLGMLEGENGLWMLRSFTRQQIPWVECAPRSSGELITEVAALIGRFLPPQEGSAIWNGSL